MKPQGFPPALRIKRRPEFLRVQNTGRKHHVRHFLVFVADRNDGARGTQIQRESGRAVAPTRIGITVTRKVGGAVVRNRIKRLVREAFRTTRREFAAGLDMVWIAKRGGASVTFSEVLADMQTLARRPRLSAGAEAR